MDLAPEVLDARAQEIVRELGYGAVPADTASGFTADLSYLSWVRRSETADDALNLVTTGRTPTVSYWWRSAPATLVAGPPQNVGVGSNVRLEDPPNTTPGMIALKLDTLGRLTWLDAVPEQVDVAPESAPVAWDRVFESMGLQIQDFTPVAPRLTPPHFASERVAWEGSFVEAPDMALRIEAAALGGRPISLRLFTDYQTLEQLVRPTGGRSLGLTTAAVLIIVGILGAFLTVVFGGLYVAHRNVRNGRGDTRGARRLGLAVFGMIGISWLFGEHSFSGNDINEFMKVLIFAGAMWGLTEALYLAVEPFMRRHSPRALIGWTRFIDGRASDPLVARDVLFGCAAGALARLCDLVPMALGSRLDTAENYIGLPMLSVPLLFEVVIGTATVYALLALGLSFLYGLSYVAVGRRPWVAYLIWVALFSAPGFVSGLSINGIRPSATSLTMIFWSLGWALWLFVLFRLGILSFLVMSTTALLLSLALPTLEFSSWYGQSIVAGLVAFAALAVFAFYRCVPWKGRLAEALGGD
jgi:hypothetical protein